MVTNGRHVVSTGIYDHIHFDRVDDAAINEMARELANERILQNCTPEDVVTLLKSLKRQAKEIEGHQLGERITDGAGSVIGGVNLVALALFSGNVHAAIVRAFQLGRAAEKLQVLFHEPDAARGKRQIAVVSENGKKRSATYQQRNARWQRMVNGYLRLHPEKNFMDACRAVARDAGVTHGAVKKRVKNPRPRR